MAAKKPVSAKTKKDRAQAKKTAQKAHPVGLHATAAQWKAYQKAYTAAYQNIRINNAARALRSRRVQNANRAVQAAGAARHQAQAASVAAFAVQQSARGAQGTAISARVNEDLRQHLAVLSRAQYAEASSRTYMQQAVQQTMTAGAAHTYEEKAFKASTRIAKTAYSNSKGARAKSGKKRGRPLKLLGGSSNASTNQNRNVDSPLKTSTTASRGRSSIHATSAHQSAKSNRATSKGNRTQAAQAKSSRNAHKSSAKSKKAAVKGAKGRAAMLPFTILKDPASPWTGDEASPTCVIDAIANSCLLMTGIRLNEEERTRLGERERLTCYESPSILVTLKTAKQFGFSSRVELKDYWVSPSHLSGVPGNVVGYETEWGPHAALMLPGYQVASWGVEIPLTSPIDEAWVLKWKVSGGRADRGRNPGSSNGSGGTLQFQSPAQPDSGMHRRLPGLETAQASPHHRGYAPAG